MPKVGGRRKKTKTHEDGEELSSDIPRSIIIKRGKVGQLLTKLVNEMRIVMYPYTALNLKESSSNSIRDFLGLVDVYGFSHMMMFTNTEQNSYMRFAKMPAGPTITFKIKDYCLSNDIYEANARNKRPLTKNFDHVPLIIMNGFNSIDIREEYDTALQTVSMMFQSFFPPLNLTEIQIKKCKRVVMVNLTLDDKDEPLLLFRHFDLQIEKYSSKKTIANLISASSLTRDLSQFGNIADYVLKASGFTSQSENDDPNLGQCEIITDKEKEEKIKVRLIEIGPRLNLQIHKIEEGFLKGNVVYHSLIKKSKKEILEMMNDLKAKRKMKKERQREQNKNIKEKEQQKTLKQTNVFDEEAKAPKETRKTRHQFLNKKTARAKPSKSKAADKKGKEMVMTKRSLKQFSNLKKFK